MAQQVEIFNIDFGDTIQSIEKLKSELKETRKLFEQAKPKTDEFSKYSSEVKRLEGTIKTLNGVTKEQTNALGGINTAAKFASGSYGELKQKISLQTKALNELTVGTEEFNNAQEELITLQAQRIEVEKKIPSLFQERIKGAINETNALKDLKAELRAANAAALNGDGKAAQRAAELRDKLEDLKDTTQSLKGSGVERLKTSTDLLTQGFADFDTDKIKTGFKGIGAAMSAIPIVLIIEGIKALIDNFDEVVKFAKNLTGGFNGAALAVKNLTKETEKDTIVNKALISTYDNEIALLSAKGGHEKEITELKKKKIAVEILEAENIIRLNSAKAAEILLNDSMTDSITKFTIALLRKTGQDEAADMQEKAINYDKRQRIKEETKAIQEAQQQIANAKNAVLVLDAENAKKSTEIAKTKAKDEVEIAIEAQARIAEVENAIIDREDEARKKSIANQKIANDMLLELERDLLENLKVLDEQAIKDKITNAQIVLINTQNQGGDLLQARLNLLNAEREQELSNTELTQSERALIIDKYREQEKQAQLQTYNEQAGAAVNYTNTLGDLSNSLFDLKRQNLEKGSDEDKAAAEQQFNINKGLSLASTAISGAQAVISASASVPYLPVGLAASVAASAATAAALVKIGTTKFQYFDGGYTSKGNPTGKAQSMGNAQFHNNEYVIPHKVLSTPEGSAMASKAEAMRKGFSKSNISGFFDGGFTNRNASMASINSFESTSNIKDIISSLPPQVLLVSDLNKVNASDKAAVNVSSL